MREMTIRPYRGSSIPQEILALSHERDLLRRRGQYDRADILKRRIEDAGYIVKDNPHGAHLVILPSVEVDGKMYQTARQLPSFLNEPDLCTFSVIILAQNSAEQAQRSVESVLSHAEKKSIEILLIDNASQDTLSAWAEELRAHESRLHTIRTTRIMGVAEARNLGLKQSRGRYILLLNAGIELTGDIFTPLEETLQNSEVGLTGAHGLRTENLRHFHKSTEHEVDALDGTCLAFRRTVLQTCELFDERYHFPQYLDIDFSFTLLDSGLRNVLTPQLPIQGTPVPGTMGKSDSEYTRLTKRNFYRFLEKWGDRYDLILYEEDDDDIDEEESE